MSPLGLLLQFVIIPFGISYLICRVVKSQMRSVYKAREASHYVTEEGTKITQRRDRYTHTTTVRTPIPKANKGPGPGGR